MKFHTFIDNVGQSSSGTKSRTCPASCRDSRSRFVSVRVPDRRGEELITGEPRCIHDGAVVLRERSGMERNDDGACCLFRGTLRTRQNARFSPLVG